MWRIFWIIALALLVVGICAVVKLPKQREVHPISGIWRSDFYNACPCGAESIYLFENGKIVEYSAEHITVHAAGHYEDLGDGRYRVFLKGTSSPDADFGPGSDPNKLMILHELADAEWVVRPGTDSWVHPPDQNLGHDRKQERRFYRPERSSKWEAIIASAPERDAKITAVVDNDEANKSQEASGNTGVLLLREDP